MPSRRAGAVAFLLIVAVASVTQGRESRDPIRLLAVTQTSPWTLVELEREPVELVSFDPDLGVAYVAATATQERRLVERGFRVATADPDPEANLRRLQGAADLGAYHTYDETVAEVDSLAALYPSICRRESLGHSLEGRDIVALKISDAPWNDDPTEPDVLVVGCHHAREFMSVEVPLHLCRTLLAGYGVHPQLTRLVDTRELWVVPMLNPDGHVYQEIFQASPEWQPPGWRKNRRDNLDGSFGVDLNRNYSYQWGHDEDGSSSDPANETYRGAAPFSEPETQLLRDFVERHRIVISLSYHSFGKLLLYPWGWTRLNLTEDQTVFSALADSMTRSNGYRAGNPYFQTIYLTNGDFDDWAYGELSQRKPIRTLAFTPELNGMEQGGFWPPESLIGPTCEALWPANVFALDVAENVRRPLPPRAPHVTGTQDARDARRIHLEWTQPVDADNPVDHWEVFELITSGSWQQSVVELRQSGRAIVARDLVRPASGKIVLALDAELQAGWDWLQVETRPPGGEWTALECSLERRAPNPAGTVQRGLTGSLHDRGVAFDLGVDSGRRFDVAVRLDAVRDAPHPGRVRAALDAVSTYREERRILDPNVRTMSYDLVVNHAGIHAYGATAVDADGQSAEGDVVFFVVPTTDVEIQDVRLEHDADRWTLRFAPRGTSAERFAVWERPWAVDELPASAAAEWARGDYRQVVSPTASTGATAALTWTSSMAQVAVLLEIHAADAVRLSGPYTASVPSAGTRLHAPVPNPFNPGTALEFDLATAGDVRLDVGTVDGRFVRRLQAGHLEAGAHRAVWDGRDAAGRAVASGVYVARLQAGGRTATQRLVLLR